MTTKTAVRFAFSWETGVNHNGNQGFLCRLPCFQILSVFPEENATTWSFEARLLDEETELEKTGFPDADAAKAAGLEAVQARLEEQLKDLTSRIGSFLPFLLSNPDEIILENRGREGNGFAVVPLAPKPEALGAFWRIKNGHHFNDEPEPEDRSDYAAYRAMIRHARILHLGSADTPAKSVPTPDEETVHAL